MAGKHEGIGNALVTTEQLATRLGREFLAEELPRARAIIGDVSSIALGETYARWTLDTAPADVKAVILSASLRTFKNPDRYVSQAIGDFSATVDRNEFSAGVFTKAEMDILQRNSQQAGFGTFGLATLGRTRDEEPSEIEYWETNIPGSPIPYIERPY